MCCSPRLQLVPQKLLRVARYCSPSHLSLGKVPSPSPSLPSFLYAQASSFLRSFFMAHLQALVLRAGGAAAFNAIAAVVLNQPAPAAGVEPAHEFNTNAALQLFLMQIALARDEFLEKPPDDSSNIAAALALRPYGRRRDVAGRPIWWRRQVAAPGWVDCPHADIAAIHSDWIRRLFCLYCRIHGMSTHLGLSAAGRASVAPQEPIEPLELARQAVATQRQAHRQAVALLPLHSQVAEPEHAADDDAADDDTLSDASTDP